MPKFLSSSAFSLLLALALKTEKHCEAHMKNEAWVFSIAGQENEVATC